MKFEIVSSIIRTGNEIVLKMLFLGFWLIDNFCERFISEQILPKLLLKVQRKKRVHGFFLYIQFQAIFLRKSSLFYRKLLETAYSGKFKAFVSVGFGRAAFEKKKEKMLQKTFKENFLNG